MLREQKRTTEMVPVILCLAWPTMLEQLFQTLVQYIDTAMVGSLGTAATAAVGATSTVGWLINSSVSALSIGFLSFISQALGEGDREKASRASSQSVVVTVITGLLFTVLTITLSRKIPVWMQVDKSLTELAGTYFLIVYSPMLFRVASVILGNVLRAAGDTKTPMRAGLIMNFVNVLLNYFMIYETRTVSLSLFNLRIPGAGLGVTGAALASAVSFAVGGIIITVKVFRHPVVSPSGSSFRPDGAILRPCLRVAVPNMLQRFGTSLGYVVFASMINSLGEISMAAHTISNTVESAFYIPGYGMQAATAALTGNTIGAGSLERMKKITKTAVMTEALLMVISGSLLFAFAPLMAAIFTDDPEVIRLCVTVLRMVAVSEPFYGVSIVIEGMMQGAGSTLMPFIFNISGMWGIRIAGTFLLVTVAGFGLPAAWGCMIAHNLSLFCCFLVYYRKGKWNALLRSSMA